MKTTKGKLLTLLAIGCILTLAFIYGGDYSSRTEIPADLAATSSSSTLAPAPPASSVQDSPAAGQDSPLSSQDEKIPETAGPVITGPITAGPETTGTGSTANAAPPAATPEVADTSAKNNEEAAPVSQDGTCTLSVNCATILNNWNLLDPAKHDLVPPDGVILPAREVVFHPGESVFNVLIREMKRNHIHFEYEDNPVYGSAYIEGISNLYEFDCGELSGWTYRVNGIYPGYGCSQYELQSGDEVEVLYTCDLGRDVGGYIEGVRN